jgi:DNA-binding beta-propeller fold protein YncE
MSRASILAAAALGLAALAAPASAGTLVISGFISGGTNGSIWLYDTVAGSFTLQGDFGAPNASAGTYRLAANEGTLYGINSRGLHSIDPFAVTATLIGDPGDVNSTSIAFDRATGQAYHAHFISPPGGSVFRFDELDITTGGITFISVPPASVTGMGYDSVLGRLVGHTSVNNRFYSIDPATGTFTLLAAPSGLGNTGLAFDPDLNVFWQVAAGKLIKRDPVTFAGTDVPISADGIQFIGLEYLPAANGVIPEPATWAMMIAGFGLVGGMARRRRAAFVHA